MIEFLKNSATKTIAVVAFIAIIFIYITFNWLIELSSFSVGLAKGVLGIFMFWIFDRYAVKEVDTINELKERNIAYAIFLLGIAIIIAAAILSS